MHILVLGAAGMVGRKLCERLLRDGRLGKSEITKLTLHDVVEPKKPEKAGFAVEFLLIDEVAAKAGVQHVAVRRIGQDAMRIRLGRHDLLCRLHDAIRSDWIDRHLVAAIGSAEQKLSAPVGGDIGHGIGQRTGTHRRQLAGPGIDGEGHHRIRLVAQADIKTLPVGADRERQRVPSPADLVRRAAAGGRTPRCSGQGSFGDSRECRHVAA